MQRSAGADRARRQTCKGPHADELLLTLDGEPVRGFASQGQARSIVLALRLAEVDEIARARGQGPLLLADDLLAELDERRASALLHTVAQAGAMVVATGTRLPASVRVGDVDTCVVDVREGTLRVRG
jgi:DNA replication and repair protein RecF